MRQKSDFCLENAYQTKTGENIFLTTLNYLRMHTIIKSIILVFNETKEQFPESHKKKKKTLKGDFKIF